MEWVLFVIAFYLCGAIVVAWNSEKALPEDYPERAWFIVWTSAIWPIGLVMYYLNPALREERKALNEKMAVGPQVSDELKQQAREAEEAYQNTKEFMLLWLKRQREQLEKNLEEAGDDDPGRAILEESISKTDEMLSRYEPQLQEK